MALDLKNLAVRTASGLVYAGLIVGAVVIGSVATAILACLLAVAASFEIENNTVKISNPATWTLTWTLDALSLICLCCVAFSFTGPYSVWLILWILLVFIRFFLQISINQNKPLESLSIFTFEQFYIGVPLALLVLCVDVVNNPWIVVCALAMIWINDTGAYLLGSLLGRHRLAPRLSPKKSWEGFFGGLLFNIGAAFIYFYCFNLNSYPFISNVAGWIFIGICVTVFATLGDLFESLLKRSLGIKDFSHLIPGHGGVLDRIDSILCVVPCVLLLILIGSYILV